MSTDMVKDLILHGISTLSGNVGSTLVPSERPWMARKKITRPPGIQAVVKSCLVTSLLEKIQPFLIRPSPGILVFEISA